MMPDSSLSVSRETMERLEIYATLLRKWNSSINLVSKATIQDMWSRHILDSTQIFDLAQHPAAHWADLGSGGGFPGLVIAIMAKEARSPLRISLVDSDTRKCTFLRTVVRETGVDATVVDARIEELDPLHADVLSARALADLTTLLSFTERHMNPDGQALFPKGESWKKEVSVAQSKWNFSHDLAKSKTESGPVILRITGVSRV